MISAIAFDYGGVIEISEKNITTEITEHLGITKEDWFHVYFSLNHLCNVGTHTWHDVTILTLEKLGVSKKQILEIEELMRLHADSKKVNTGLVEIIKTLKPNYKIALISNYASHLRQKLIDQKIIDLFDEVIISGEVGIQKPQPEIFQLLCIRLGIETSELLFIDDTKKSLEGAVQIGYTPILYTSNEQLSQDLEQLLVQPLAISL